MLSSQVQQENKEQVAVEDNGAEAIMGTKMLHASSPTTATPDDGHCDSRSGYQWYLAYGSNNSYEQLLRRLGHVDPYYFGVDVARGTVTIGGDDERSKSESSCQQNNKESAHDVENNDNRTSATAVPNFSGVKGGRDPSAPPPPLLPSVFSSHRLKAPLLSSSSPSSPPHHVNDDYDDDDHVEDCFSLLSRGVYPPLAVRVVLLPWWYFVIDAPSACKGLGYANIKRCTKFEPSESTGASPIDSTEYIMDGCVDALPCRGVVGSDATERQVAGGDTTIKRRAVLPAGKADMDALTTQHPADACGRSQEEVSARPPYVVAVAYLLSNAQLKMMDLYENAPDKYRRTAVRGVVVKEARERRGATRVKKARSTDKAGEGAVNTTRSSKQCTRIVGETCLSFLPPFTFEPSSVAGPRPCTEDEERPPQPSHVVTVPRDEGVRIRIAESVRRIVREIIHAEEESMKGKEKEDDDDTKKKEKDSSSAPESSVGPRPLGRIAGDLMRKFLLAHQSTPSSFSPPHPSTCTAVIRSDAAVQTVATVVGIDEETTKADCGSVNGNNVFYVCDEQHQQEQLGPLADAMAIAALREANASHNSAVGSVINGVAYVYTTPCDDEDENKALLLIDQHNNADSGGSQQRRQIPSWRLNARESSDERPLLLLRPSSSYMGRILEGEYFFGPRGNATTECERSADISRCISACPCMAAAANACCPQSFPSSSSSPSPPSDPIIAPYSASSVSSSPSSSSFPCDVEEDEEDQLLALYIQYLRSIEISHITSPRALLRAAGRV